MTERFGYVNKLREAAAEDCFIATAGDVRYLLEVLDECLNPDGKVVSAIYDYIYATEAYADALKSTQDDDVDFEDSSAYQSTWAEGMKMALTALLSNSPFPETVRNLPLESVIDETEMYRSEVTDLVGDDSED